MRVFAQSLDCNWNSLLVKRLNTLCPGYVFGIEFTKSMWFIRLGVISLENRIIALRSLCNGWATSYRYHEAILLPCLFGCCMLGPIDIRRKSCNDEMSHYMSCLCYGKSCVVLLERNCFIYLIVWELGGKMGFLTLYWPTIFTTLSNSAEENGPPP